MEGENNKIEQFVLLAATAKGLALVDLIKRVTSEEGIFGFGELLAVPSVQDLRNGDHTKYHAMLELFAYGTWPDYREKQQHLPELSPAQVTKLKQLTVITLATTHKVLPYSLVMQQLEVESLRDFEDMIIGQCIYSGLMDGRLDQQHSRILVFSTYGRDVRPSQLPQLVNALDTWAQHTKWVVDSVEERHSSAQAAAAAAQALAESRAKEHNDVVSAVKVSVNDAMQHQDYGEGSLGDAMDEDRVAAPMRPKRSRRGLH